MFFIIFITSEYLSVAKASSGKPHAPGAGIFPPFCTAQRQFDGTRRPFDSCVVSLYFTVFPALSRRRYFCELSLPFATPAFTFTR